MRPRVRTFEQQTKHDLFFNAIQPPSPCHGRLANIGSFTCVGIQQLVPLAHQEKIKPCLQRVLVLQHEASSHRFVEEAWEQQEQLPHFDHSHIRQIVNPFTI